MTGHFGQFAARAGSAMAIGLSSAAVAASGATAPFNEAVRLIDGRRVVEVAPFPTHMRSVIGLLKRPVDYPTQVAVRTIETNEGLMDCYSTLWYHPNACNPSTFGKEVRYRTWVVLMRGTWFACASHLSASSCVPIITDGRLRPIPGSEE